MTDWFQPAGDGYVHQGEVLSHVVIVRQDVAAIGAEPSALAAQILPFAVVLTQECDLLWDFEARQAADFAPDHNRAVPEIVLCEAFTRSEAIARGMTQGLFEKYMKLQEERRHGFPAVSPDVDALGDGFEELILDFKRLRAFPTEELYHRLTLPNGNADRIERRCRLSMPHREQLSDRFFHYQARIGLPDMLGGAAATKALTQRTDLLAVPDLGPTTAT